MALKPNSQAVLDYVKAHDGEDFTAKDMEAAPIIGEDGNPLTVKQINGIITSAFQKKGLMFRDEVAITGGTAKYIRLTDEGRNFEDDAE